MPIAADGEQEPEEEPAAETNAAIAWHGEDA
jgi:hypothetical protein